MSKFILALFIFISNPVHADSWTQDDIRREQEYLTYHILDWAQTRHISSRPETWYETNSILGKHPSAIKVDRYFLATGLAHIGVSAILPRDLRAVFQHVSIVIESGFVNHNFSIGLSAGF